MGAAFAHSGKQAQTRGRFCAPKSNKSWALLIFLESKNILKDNIFIIYAFIKKVSVFVMNSRLQIGARLSQVFFIAYFFPHCFLLYYKLFVQSNGILDG